MFTMMFSSTSYAEWTKVTYNAAGSLYIDYERIRKHDGYVYYWVLVDFLERTESGHLSGKLYKQGDCNLFRWKFLSISNHKEPMGGGTAETMTYNDDDWKYPPPNSTFEVSLNQVCNW